MLAFIVLQVMLQNCETSYLLNCLNFVYTSVNPENKWFLSSSSWPCEPADLESRTRVLIRLAEKTSHRDTLELLCNLPGVKESSGE